MADTAAALLIQLSAETRDFRREMRSATGFFDAETRKMERTQQRLKKNIQQNFSGLGRNMTGYLSGAAVVAFGRHILNTADALSDASQQLGITTQQLQGLDYAARISGASSEKLTQALGYLSDGLGEAQKGEGDLAKLMREKNIAMGDTIDVLYDIADRVKNATTQQEKMNIATQAFGSKAGKTMVSFLNQGAEGLRRLQQEASAKGQIWDPETLTRLDAAKDSFITLEKAVVNLAAVPASAFINDLAKLLESLAAGDWRSGLDKLAGLMPTLAGAAAGGRIAGVPGAIVGGAAGAYASSGGSVEAKIAELQQKLKNPNLESADRKFTQWRLDDLQSRQPKLQPYNGPFDAASIGGGRECTAVPQSAAQSAKAGKDAARALENARRVSEMLAAANEDARRSTDDVMQATRDVVIAQDQALLQRAQGWSNYAEIQREVIEEQTNLEIQQLEAQRDRELRALELRRVQDLERIEELQANLQQRADLESSFETQRVALVERSSAEIKAIREREASEIAQIQTRELELGRELRAGLTDIAMAGLHGFDSMEDAALRFLERIGEMIVELYVIKPLLESLNLGGEGGGGGGFGGIFSLFNFAKGGVMTPNGPRQLKRFANGGRSNQAAIFGEAGPEAAVPLPDGRRIPVELRVPQIPAGAAMGSGGVVQNFTIDLSGAVVTDELYARVSREAALQAQKAVATYDRNVIPGRVRTLNSDPRRNY